MKHLKTTVRKKKLLGKDNSVKGERKRNNLKIKHKKTKTNLKNTLLEQDKTEKEQIGNGQLREGNLFYMTNLKNKYRGILKIKKKRHF